MPWRTGWRGCLHLPIATGCSPRSASGPSTSRPASHPNRCGHSSAMRRSQRPAPPGRRRSAARSSAAPHARARSLRRRCREWSHIVARPPAHRWQPASPQSSSRRRREVATPSSPHPGPRVIARWIFSREAACSASAISPPSPRPPARPSLPFPGRAASAARAAAAFNPGIDLRPRRRRAQPRSSPSRAVRSRVGRR
jgi:hypothetical protein